MVLEWIRSYIPIIRLLLIRCVNLYINSSLRIGCLLNGSYIISTQGCSDGILAPSLLPPRTSPVVAALPCYWIVIKSSSVCCICFYIFAFLLLCLVFLCYCLCCPLGRILYYNVCHFCCSCCRVWVLLCNQLGFLPTRFGSVPML